jgi:peptidylprolyl isomerase
MKKLLLLIIIFISILSCEDTKKPPTKKELDSTTLEKKIEKIVEKKVIPIKSTYPKITQENAVDFLTEYGKNNPETKVLISTNHGNITLQLFKDTPLHRANFIYLAKSEYFNKTFFHRVVPNFIIQAGSSDLLDTSKKRAKIGQSYRLPYEKGNGRIHKSGTVSGAKHYRKNPDNLSVPFEFFIFLGPKSSTAHLNGKYTIFGKVTKGMDVVKKIANLPADGDEWPLNNVYITVEVLE